jgi:hypothetical protein
MDVFDFPLLEEKVTSVTQEAVLSVLEGKSFQQGKVGFSFVLHTSWHNSRETDRWQNGQIR